MNKIVWVFGESASGKETFIRYAVDNPDCELMQQLGFSNSKLIPIEESMHKGEAKIGSSSSYDRIKIKDVVLDLSQTEDNAVFLIKWQAVDSIHIKYGDALRKLALQTPDTLKQIILLSVESNTLYSRLPSKYWWKDVNYSQEKMNESVTKMRSHIVDLLELGFTVVEINATNGYELLENNTLKTEKKK